MNETSEQDTLANEIFVFSPSRGVQMNVTPQNLPANDDATNRFELIGNNPLIKTNKTNNFAEYDYYIEDPSNPEIKNELVNDIVFSSGRCCLKKNAIEILYCSFDVILSEERFSLQNNPTLNFYINILLMYPPELKQNSLLQYFSILHKIIENREITLEYKYLITNKALEIEWEKCSFGKYNHFKTFFSFMKKFFKISPLFTEEQFLEENTTNIFQDFIKRTLAGRAIAIIQNIVDSDDQLKLLMLFKTIEWLQKLENLKLLLNLNLGFLINKGKDKVAIDLLKQMYGRSPFAFTTLQGADHLESPHLEPKFEDAVDPKEQSPTTKFGSSSDQAPPPSRAEKHAKSRAAAVPTIENALSDSQKFKLSKPTLSELETNSNERSRGAESNSNKKDVQRDSIKIEGGAAGVGAGVGVGGAKEGTSNKMSGEEKNQNKVNLFFDLQNAVKFQGDYAGRINNFLKKSSKLGYEYSVSDQEKIESIVLKFKNSMTVDQLNDLLRNYKKFCGDYQVLVNPQVIQTLEGQKTTPTAAPLNEKSKSPPRKTQNTLKILKSTSTLPSSLPSSQSSAGKVMIPLQQDELSEGGRSSGKPKIEKERKSREKEKEEIKGPSTFNSETKEREKSKTEKRKSDQPVFPPRGFFERYSSRISDE